MSSWIDAVLAAARTSTRGPAGGLNDSSIAGALGIHLPPLHVDLLRRANGVQLYDGYFKLFPVDAPNLWSMVSWNDPATWKFAWSADLDEFLCFGETIWGDQYAYRHSDLQAFVDAPVYFLDALRMQSRRLTDGFDEFGDKYLTRNSTDPFDSVLRAAHERLGPIESDVHLVFSPPVLLSGEERLEDVVRMPARQAMILNGDLWTQLSNPPASSRVARLELIKDTEGRERMRVAWEPA